MARKKIYLSPPHLTEDALSFVNDAIQSNWIAPVGPDVDAFEKELATVLKVDHVITTNSGTSAIHLGLLALGVSKGDEVVCSTFTFCASANPVVYCGAFPVFVDSELTTWNMDPDLLRHAIEDRIRKTGRKPKAIIVVHLYGMPAQLNRILEVGRLYDIPVLEDSAEALGSLYNAQQVGTFGDVGVLSFNGNKIVTASSGGALFSSKKDLIERARYLRQEARESVTWYEHKEVGFNYRLSNILAALGRSQLKILNDRVLKRRAVFSFYERELSSIPGVEFQPEPDNMRSNRWLSAVVFEHPGVAEKIRRSLADEDVECRPLWKPMHLQPAFAGCPFYGNGISDDLFKRGLCLPSGSDLEESDLRRIVLGMIKVFA